jgi:hypothetical protein
MALISRNKNAQQHEAARLEAEEAAMRERALRLVDTQGVVVRAAEAELQAAIAELRSSSTPSSEQRVAEAKRALMEARQALEEARSA